MTANRRISAASIIGNTVVREKWLSIGIILTVTGAVVISLLPPLVLGKIIDRIAGGNFPGFSMAAEYFLLIFLSGFSKNSWPKPLCSAAILMSRLS